MVTDLSALGFQRRTDIKRHNQCWLGKGKIKARKTSFAMGLPQPIGFLNFDRSLDDVLIHYPQVDVVVKDFQYDPMGLEQNDAKLIEQEFAQACNALHKDKHIRSIVLDKETILWELVRFAEFGRLSGVKARNYEHANTRMRAYLSQYMQSGKNFYMIGESRDEWIDDKPTGRLIHDGFKQSAGIAQVVANFDTDGQNFKMRLDACIATHLVGLEFENDGINFAEIAPLIMPESDAADWR